MWYDSFFCTRGSLLSHSYTAHPLYVGQTPRSGSQSSAGSRPTVPAVDRSTTGSHPKNQPFCSGSQSTAGFHPVDYWKSHKKPAVLFWQSVDCRLSPDRVLVYIYHSIGVKKQQKSTKRRKICGRIPALDRSKIRRKKSYTTSSSLPIDLRHSTGLPERGVTYTYYSYYY